jgi:DNA polymerase III delta subunit
MAEEMKRAYLIAGGDGAKIDAALARLRARAVREGGQGALESHPASAGAGPDVDALLGSLPAISLMSERRYLLADGVELWRSAQVKRVAEALPDAPPETTLVLVARGTSPKGLADAVRGAGGEVLSFEAPGKRQLPAWVLAAARERGIALDAKAARELIARVGEGTVRLTTELDRIALWAGEGSRVGAEEIAELTTDTSERAGWTLADAIVAQDGEAALIAADELLTQGEAVTPMVYGMASRLRNAHRAAVGLEAGRPAKEVEADLPMAPYPSKMLVRSVRGTSSAELSEAIEAVAELEWWTRGGSDYDDEVALVLAVRRAAGAGG